MSQSIRQSELFVGEDWISIYKAFTQINFAAYDYHTIRAAMVEYIRTNYSEDFNDWIDSSEFVAYIDLLSYLGQSLAFRTDVNARENFIDVAERRESILRLARYLGYYPKRNYPARGMVKLTEIRCNQDIFDSKGKNINGLPIRWNNPNDPDWFERWLLVLNASFISGNPFGIPLKSSTLDGITTQLYRFNSTKSIFGAIPFQSSINGIVNKFEIVNCDFSSTKGFFERYPDPTVPYHVIYRNDGNGNSSKNTGFFLMFKQGQLLKQDYLITESIENRKIDLSPDKINETDVWVQNIKENGNIEPDGVWERIAVVPQDQMFKIYMNSENTTYNSQDIKIRKIFQTITRDNDKVSLRFGDGKFGEIPTGKIRVWYRVSNGESYMIKPDDIRNVMVTVPYITNRSLNKSLYLTFSLEETIGNSVPAETNEQIKRRASQLVTVQSRMVSGEDYNTLPQQNNLALKVKAVNRYYSGQSKFLDLNDPTGNYNSTNVFGDDGALYINNREDQIQISFNTKSPSEILNTIIIPRLSWNNVRDFLQNEWMEFGVTEGYDFNFQYQHPVVYWKPSSNKIFSSSGYFVFYEQEETYPGSGVFQTVEKVAHPGSFVDKNPLDYVSQGCLIKFKNSGWVSVMKYTPDTSGSGVYTNYVDGYHNNTDEGAITLNEVVDGEPKGNYDIVEWVLPTIVNTFTSNLTSIIIDSLTQMRTFGIGYDYEHKEWFYIDTTEIASSGDYKWASRKSSTDNSWVIKFEYTPQNWIVKTRVLDYIFESERTTKFYLANSKSSIDPDTRKEISEKIIISNNNTIGSELWKPKNSYTFGNVVKVSKYDEGGLRYSLYYMCISNHISGWHYYTYDIHGNRISNWWNNDPNTYGPYEYKSDFPLTDLYDGSNGSNINRLPVWKQISPSISKNQEWKIDRPFIYNDGYVEPRRITVVGFDSDKDGQVDNPQGFMELSGMNDWVILEKYTSVDGSIYYKLNPNIKAININEPFPLLQPYEIVMLYVPFTNINYFTPCDSADVNREDKYGLLGFWMFNRSEPNVPFLHPYSLIQNNYKRVTESPNKITPWFVSMDKIGRGDEFKVYKGRTGLSYQWKHVSSMDNRIDPAPSNLIDIYILSKEYNDLMNIWIKEGAIYKYIPQPPSELQLKISFQELEQYKMFSDELVWRPVKYKLLFGDLANSELQARFRVIKIPGTSASDGEIKTEIISYIEIFFDPKGWDFGETFFASELVAYIHTMMPNSISSFSIQSKNSITNESFDIKANADELFFPLVRVDDIEIISTNSIN